MYSVQTEFANIESVSVMDIQLNMKLYRESQSGFSFLAFVCKRMLLLSYRKELSEINNEYRNFTDKNM